MFGALRLALALGVVLAHLGWGAYVGRFSVFAFYVISGYLMCLVLDRRYGFTWPGVRDYAVNRFLRIFPSYWAACALSVALLLWFGNPRFGVLWYPWSLPSTPVDWISNLSIAGLPSGHADRLVAPAWALRVELFYYMALAAGLARGPVVAVLWALAAAAWHVHLGIAGAGPDARYYPIAAAALPFSLGACAYHARGPLARRVRRPATWASVAALAWLGNAVIAGALHAGGTALPFYVSCAVSALLVALLSLPIAAAARVRRLDARLGDLSYPVYLVHMQVGFWVASLTSLPQHGLSLFFGALPCVLGGAWLLLRAVDRPIERLRARVRARHDPPVNAGPVPDPGLPSKG
jgi:peptidoglycan/LPS O-acetylase OafA/YrhL